MNSITCNMKLISLCLILLITSCRGEKNKFKFKTYEEKFFYTDCNGFDYIRFPLIMPYEAMCIDRENWIINLNPGVGYYLSINDILEVSVVDSMIFVHTNSTGFFDGDHEPWQWFVVIPSKKIEIGFSTKKEFEKYLEQFNTREINWINIENAYYQFKDTECLPWIPGCSN